jgi:TRAP transporter 4TM/12TM fusion protein
LVGLAVVSIGYVVFRHDYIIFHQVGLRTFELVLGSILFLVVLEAGRRVIGNVFPLLIGLVFLYAIGGRLIPGYFGHLGFSLRHIIEYFYFGSEGIWGFFLGISATTIALYVILAPVLLQTGGAKAFYTVALFISGRAAGGPAKVACISSAMFGTISGSCVANVATTGAFTIPMMKRLGYPPPLAAAIEAIASTGGILMPPIMGASAFIMAELLGIRYFKICVIGIIPAVLYFTAIMLGIHFEAKRISLPPIPEEQIPHWNDVLRWSLLAPILLPFSVLITLLFKGFSPDLSALATLGTATALYIFTGGPFSLKQMSVRARQLIEALQVGARALAGVAVLIACAQILVSFVNLTGLGNKFSSLVIAVGGSSLILALVLAAIVCLILGMGMPATGAYVLSVTIAGMALAKLGVSPIGAHMFMFYFSILSAVTPPVCSAVFIAAGLADTPWMKAAWIAVRMTLPTYIVAFMFGLDPALLLQGESVWIITSVVTAGLGVVCVGAGAMGYFVRNADIITRCVLIAAAMMLVVPGTLSDIAGFILLGATYLWQRLDLRTSFAKLVARKMGN